jgi:uncharacterized membrane protein
MSTTHLRPAVVLGLMLAAACAGDDPTTIVALPSIALSPEAPVFTAVTGGANPTPQTVTIANDGGGTLDGLTVDVRYDPGAATGWLYYDPGAKTAPSTLGLRPHTENLAAGTYRATVTIAAANASNSPRSMVVTFTVTQSTTAVIGLSVDAWGFTVTQGGANPAAATVQITNLGGGTLSGLTRAITYNAGEPAGWLTATLNTTTAPATLTLRGTTGTLTPEFYQAQVAVSSPVANNSPRNVRVDFSVRPTSGAALGLTPHVVALSSTPAAALHSQFIVFNVGSDSIPSLTATVTYQAGQPTGWLNATLNRTTAPASVFLNATKGTLTAGTYNAIVAVAGAAAVNSPRSVAVTFTVTP